MALSAKVNKAIVTAFANLNVKAVACPARTAV